MAKLGVSVYVEWGQSPPLIMIITVSSLGPPGRQPKKYTSTPGPGFLLKGIQAWIPFKRNLGPGQGGQG